MKRRSSYMKRWNCDSLETGILLNFNEERFLQAFQVIQITRKKQEMFPQYYMGSDDIRRYITKRLITYNSLHKWNGLLQSTMTNINKLLKVQCLHKSQSFRTKWTVPIWQVKTTVFWTIFSIINCKSHKQIETNSFLAFEAMIFRQKTHD